MAIATKNLRKSFKDGSHETHVLKGIDFVANDGEFISIMGRSGAGKSTFLYQISLLDDPTGGEVIINEKQTELMTQEERVLFRLREFGYVFQDYALLPELTALENVALPLLMAGKSKKQAYAEATVSLERMNLAHVATHLPSALSGGEQQRTSIARAVAHAPKVLFADEPTANLDNESSRIVMQIFKELHKKGQTIIMVTHEEEFAHMAERVIHLDDGKIISEQKMH